MSLRKAAAIMDCPEDDRNVWAPDNIKGSSFNHHSFRVPGLSSSEDSSGSSSSDEACGRSRGDTPWRRRKKRHRPAIAHSQACQGQSPMEEADMMDTHQPQLTTVKQTVPSRRPNFVWASVLADSVLDDAMSSQMHMHRSDRNVESYAYPSSLEARSGRNDGSGGERRKAALEEGEISSDDEENEDHIEGGVAEDDGEYSHSDSLSIDNNVDPGEFAREGERGRYDMQEIEDMDTNSRSALPSGCVPSTSAVTNPAINQLPQHETVSNPVQQLLGRKRQLRKKSNHNRCGGRNVRNRLGKRSFDPNKNRPHFDLGPERSDKQISSDVAERLRESRNDLLLRCVRLLGREKTYHMLLVTEDLEEAGGIYTLDGSRRRTPGGVYFHLLKEDESVSAEIKRQIFAPPDDDSCRKEKKKRKRISAPRRLHRHGSSSDHSGPVLPPDVPPAPPGLMMNTSNLTPPHASTTSSSPPSSTLASTEAASSGKTPNNSPRPAPLEVDDF